MAAGVEALQPPDYVLFYAKLCSFPEDASCQVKHASRRAFEQLCRAGGLSIAKHSAELPDSRAHVAASNELQLRTRGRTPGRSRKRNRGAPYKAFYWALRATAEALMREAEFVRLELPLKQLDGSRPTPPRTEGSADFEDGDRVDELRYDVISAPFAYSKRGAFFEAEDGSVPLTDAQRIFLTQSILRRIDTSDVLRRSLGQNPMEAFCTTDCVFCASLGERVLQCAPIVLQHLLEAKVFADAYPMHSGAGAPAELHQSGCCCPASSCCRSPDGSVTPEESDVPQLTRGPAKPRPAVPDQRQKLHRIWGCCSGYQPLRLIREYFGEKLAFYYAWMGHFITSLTWLAIIGAACLVYGLVNASLNHKSEAAQLIIQLANVTVSDGNGFSISLLELMQFIRLVFENHLTIPFGCVLTIWNLATAEGWKATEASLSHRWNVKRHELAERPRPGFNPPSRWKSSAPSLARCLGPLSVVVFCAAIAVAVAVSIEVSKLAASGQHCTSSPAACICMSILLPIGGHLVVMALMDWGYSHLAKKLTDWENHQYQSDHDASYAVKSCAFRFANNFASMFYTAFVRQQEVAFGDFTDRCVQGKVNIDCYNLLSVYSAGYIIGKSLLKLLIDCVSHHASQRGSPASCLPSPLRRLLCSCGASLRQAAYSAELDVLAAMERRRAATESGGFSPELLRLIRERDMPKEKSDHQQLDDYLEKMTLHGYLAMFGSACFLAPLAVLIAVLVDLKLDARRLTLSHRRPAPLPAQGVGVWNQLRDLLGHAGVLTTAGVLGFTSDSLRIHGLEPSVANRLVLSIVFSGAMYLLKYLMSIYGSGQSNVLKNRLKWEYQNIPKILETGSVTREALDDLDRMQSGDRWFHGLFPCTAGAAPPRPESGPNQV